jgi:hypothetical protein
MLLQDFHTPVGARLARDSALGLTTHFLNKSIGGYAAQPATVPKNL